MKRQLILLKALTGPVGLMFCLLMNHSIHHWWLFWFSEDPRQLFYALGFSLTTLAYLGHYRVLTRGFRSAQIRIKSRSALLWFMLAATLGYELSKAVILFTPDAAGGVNVLKAIGLGYVLGLTLRRYQHYINKVKDIFQRIQWF